MAWVSLESWVPLLWNSGWLMKMVFLQFVDLAPVVASLSTSLLLAMPV